uniref:Uncharacterized protein n=1 Tax=Acrobeloides nanus TaxID=290746 RepID=A0A914DNM5_9BILA
MVDFMLLELNLTTFMYQLEANPFGIDEIMVPTLQVTDELNVPGGFTHACLDKGIDVAHITRKSIWELRSDPYRCPTKKFRHLICMFGIEDLDRLTKSTELFVNKIMPEFDFGAVICWYEKMFNRTYLEEPTAEKLDKNYYLSLPHVRFHHEKLKSNGNLDVQNFDCKTGNIYAKSNNFVEYFFDQE